MGIQQMLTAGGLEGAPQNQSGGVNPTFQPNGTTSITTGSNMSPVNWMSIAPQPGVGANYWIKFTFVSTASGAATAIGNNGAWLNLATAQSTTATGGAGSVNVSYVIAASSGGATIASGTFVENNTI